jgi:hypothetical protein
LTENLRFSKGNLNTNVIERRSQSLKLLEELQNLVVKELLEDDFTRSRSKKYGKGEHDVSDAVKLIIKNSLLEDLGPRFHDGMLQYGEVKVPSVLYVWLKKRSIT